MSLLFNQQIMNIHLKDKTHVLHWLNGWQQGVAKYFRYLKIQEYQYFYCEDHSHHSGWCSSAIDVDLRNSDTPATYVKDTLCQDCPRVEKAVDRVNEVVRSLEWIGGGWQLTKCGMVSAFEAAAWEICYDVTRVEFERSIL